MIKCRFVFEGEVGDHSHDPGFGIQPQFVDDTLKFLGAFGVSYSDQLWVPEKAVFDVHQQAFVITMSHFVPEIATTPSIEPESFFQADQEDEDEPELENPEQLTPADKRKLFKLITKAREENENE